jgi:hypothetical protein
MKLHRMTAVILKALAAARTRMADGGGSGAVTTFLGLPLRLTMGGGTCTTGSPAGGGSCSVTTSGGAGSLGLLRLPGGLPRRLFTSPPSLLVEAASGRRGSVPGVGGNTTTRGARRRNVDGGGDTSPEELEVFSPLWESPSQTRRVAVSAVECTKESGQREQTHVYKPSESQQSTRKSTNSCAQAGQRE